MHVITKKRLREFWYHHPDAERPLRSWFAIMNRKNYKAPHEVRADFPTASFLGKWRIVFNIGGNKYRLVVDLRYDLGRIYIRQVLTHEDYDHHSRQGTL